MLNKFVSLLLFLPAALSVVEILITVKALNKDNVSIRLAGHSDALVEQCDLTQDFQLTEERVKEAVSKISGKPPDRIYYHDPTPENTYTKRRWSPVKLTVRAQKASVIEIYYKPEALQRKDFTNTDWSKASNNIFIMLDEYRNFIALNSLFPDRGTCVKDGFIKISQDLRALDMLYGVSFQEMNAPYDHSESRMNFIIPSPIMGTSDVLSGQTVQATLTAKLVTVRIELIYSINVRGDIYCRYIEPLDGKSDWKHTIDTVLRKLNLPQTINRKTEIKLEFIADPEVHIRDLKTNKEIEFVYTKDETTAKPSSAKLLIYCSCCDIIFSSLLSFLLPNWLFIMN